MTQANMTGANIGHSEAASTVWDVVVIGAGPAGAVAARQAACSGHRTLLVDKQVFPRPKVCGACVNARAVEVLRILGMGPCASQMPSVSLDAFALHCGRRRATLSLAGGKAIARSTFDDGLVRQAMDSGAKWLPETTAIVGELTGDGSARVVELMGANLKKGAHPRKGANQRQGHVACARIVLVADGLGSPSLQRRKDEFPTEVSPRARVGVGGQLDDWPQDYASGTIHMSVAREGYVGVVRLYDGSLNIAAALDAGFLKKQPELGVGVASILRSAGMPPLDLREVIWKGTPRLTRKIIRPASTRVLVLGDAAGYVEPFTGEGIAWAITSGAAAATLLPEGIAVWTEALETRWLELSRSMVGRHQLVCRLMANTLRSQSLAAAATLLVSVFPCLAVPLVSRSSRLPSGMRRILTSLDGGRRTPCSDHDQPAHAARSTNGVPCR